MSKKNKNKKKKINPKRERYSKFHKEKTTTMDITMPELSDDLVTQKRTDEDKINKFVRFAKNPPTKEVSERKMKSKR